jgi:tetratricopeptide (TPR) repeat protein
MKHRTLLLLLLFLLFFLQSCAQPGSFDSERDRLEMLDQYLADQDFGKALTLIVDTPEEHPEAMVLEKKREMVMDALRSYEKQAVSRALKLERNNEWPAARLSYEEALEKSGHSKNLEDAEGAMLQRFRGRMDALELEELIVTAEWLQKKLPLLQDLHESDPADKAIHQRYSRAQNDAKEVARQLLQRGEQMLTEKNLVMAGRIIPLVVKLAPSPAADSEMNRLNRQLKEKTLKKQKDRKKHARKKDRKSMESFNKAMGTGDLSEAQRNLSRLTPDTKKSVAAELMQERLDKEISEYVQEELSVGDSFYRAGKYEQAIKIWQAIIELEPENKTVKSKIERAKVIVEKVQSLRERQAGESEAQITN